MMLKRLQGRKFLVLSGSAGLFDMSARLSGLGATVTHVSDLGASDPVSPELTSRARQAGLAWFSLAPQRPEAQGLLQRLSRTVDIIVDAFGDVDLETPAHVLPVAYAGSVPFPAGEQGGDETDLSARSAGLSALLGVMAGEAIHLPPHRHAPAQAPGRIGPSSHNLFETMEGIGVTSAQTACLLAEGVLA